MANSDMSAPSSVKMAGPPGKADGPEAYQYKFKDDKFLLNYHGTNVFYPFYLTLPEIETFEADPSDVAIVTFPKCGTTFMTAILHMINHNGDAKCMTGGGPPLDSFFPFMEMCTPTMPRQAWPISKLKAAKPPRDYYTHLGYDALPKGILEKSKIIYIARNPKDTIVSMHNFIRATPSMDFTGTMEDTFDSFVNNRCIYAPFYDHVADFWSKKDSHKNIFFTTFERLLKDFKNVVRDLGKFLGKDLSEEQLDTIQYYCNFESMKKNALTNREQIAKSGHWDFSVSPFLRAGKAGNWKENFSPELNKRVDQWIAEEEERVKDRLAGFHFEYE